MKSIFVVLAITVCLTGSCYADNVILMIGDGMGLNHLNCVEKTDTLFIKKMPVQGEVKTYSADSKITDSAAGATAYACGIKTNNGYLAMTPQENPCETIAEKAIKAGYFVGIRSTDEETGATPSAFYVHNKSRRAAEEIKKEMKAASLQMNIAFVSSVEKSTKKILRTAATQKKPFFIMIEGAKIDVESHKNDYDKMKKELLDFDRAVEKAVQFVNKRKDTTLIVVADHETGGLTNDCTYTTNKHTPVNIGYFAAGNKSHLLSEPIIENTTIYEKMNQILFNQ